MLLAAASSPAYASASQCGHQIGSATNWVPPPAGIVNNQRDAISIAYIAWASINPKMKSVKPDEWQTDMSARLQDNVWIVTQKDAAKYVNNLIISISRCDGRVVDVRMTQ